MKFDIQSKMKNATSSRIGKFVTAAAGWYLFVVGIVSLAKGPSAIGLSRLLGGFLGLVGASVIYAQFFGRYVSSHRSSLDRAASRVTEEMTSFAKDLTTTRSPPFRFLIAFLVGTFAFIAMLATIRWAILGSHFALSYPPECTDSLKTIQECYWSDVEITAACFGFPSFFLGLFALTGLSSARDGWSIIRPMRDGKFQGASAQDWGFWIAIGISAVMVFILSVAVFLSGP